MCFPNITWMLTRCLLCVPAPCTGRTGGRIPGLRGQGWMAATGTVIKTWVEKPIHYVFLSVSCLLFLLLDNGPFNKFIYFCMPITLRSYRPPIFNKCAHTLSVILCNLSLNVTLLCCCLKVVFRSCTHSCLRFFLHWLICWEQVKGYREENNVNLLQNW